MGHHAKKRTTVKRHKKLRPTRRGSPRQLEERIMPSTRPVGGSSLAFFSGSPLCSACRESVQRFRQGILHIPVRIQAQRSTQISRQFFQEASGQLSLTNWLIVLNAMGLDHQVTKSTITGCEPADGARQRGDSAVRREVPGAQRRVRKPSALWAADEQKRKLHITSLGAETASAAKSRGALGGGAVREPVGWIRWLPCPRLD
jgi:hypothetical protein